MVYHWSYIVNKVRVGVWGWGGGGGANFQLTEINSKREAKGMLPRTGFRDLGSLVLTPNYQHINVCVSATLHYGDGGLRRGLTVFPNQKLIHSVWT
jgi:hypothetical protein